MRDQQHESGAPQPINLSRGACGIFSLLCQRQSQPLLLAGIVAILAAGVHGLTPGSSSLTHRVALPCCVGEAASGQRTVVPVWQQMEPNRQGDHILLCFLMKKGDLLTARLHFGLKDLPPGCSAREQVKGEARF